MNKIEWSPYQSKIFDTYRDTDSNIAIKAGPGSGKTTVLKQLCKLTPPALDSVFLAFNKSIVEELKANLPSNVSVSTLHSLGMSMITRTYGSVKLDTNKTFGVLKKLENKWKDDLKETKSVNGYFYKLTQLYELFRQNLLKDVGDELATLGGRHGYDVGELELKHMGQLVNAMAKINRGGSGRFSIDFMDMIYLPVVKGLSPIKRYDRVFLDESQDLNQCQHQLVYLLLGRSTRLITVGDPNQCIYAFLGADSASFEAFSKRPNTITLPLSISYRCPKKVVEKVNTVFNVVEAAPDAIEGDVREDGDFSEVDYGDMVLCRNNKPLLLGYLRLIEEEKKCWIRGAEFGKGIVKMITPYRTLGADACMEKLYSDLEELEAKLHKRGVWSPKKHSSYIKFADNIELVNIIAQRYRKVSEMIPIMSEIFKDDGEGIMLSTIHKAKGLEAERVFLLEPQLIPSEYATQAWELEQEKKLLFVAYSRAKKELVFINSYR